MKQRWEERFEVLDKVLEVEKEQIANGKQENR
jgi:hypothetical protein